jgi:alpha-D-xyloside xylohydrolase
MKFSAGYWNMRPGYIPYFASEAREVEIGQNSLTVYAPTKRIQQRGDTLNLPLLTVRFTAPLENVIRVQLYHHKGGAARRPIFTIYENPPQINIEEDSQAARLTSGQLSVRVNKGEWRIDFMNGEKPITQSGWKGMGFVDTPEGRFIHEQLALGVGECVYGLGERFTPFVKNGQVVEMWNEDGGTSSEIAYKNIPFYLTNRGYGVLVSHPEKVSFEVGSEKVERVQFSVAGEYLEYYLIYGPEPKQVLERYTALTGRPALPPPWSFGLWLSTSFTTSYDEKTVTSFIEGMQERDIPLHVFHFDCFWMKEFHWVNFEWDKTVFPDPKGMLERLKARGLKICVWINPYIAQRSRLFEEGKAEGYLLKKPDGSVYQTDQWQSGMGLVDFTNPEACAWYANELRALLVMGVDCFKTDFGERIPTEVIYHDGSDPRLMHNYYSYLYNKTVFEVLETRFGKGNATVFARSATTGGQQFPVHWGGDSTATFESMAETLRGGLSLSLSGFGFWSHDIGGFEQTASADVYKRWCAFGLLSSHSRLHGSTSYRVPWLFDEEAVEVLRFFTEWKCRLMPYLYAAGLQAHQQGLPMLRPMLLEFPDDMTCDYLDRQYMLGDALLVAPIFSHDNNVDYYVPKGRWTSLLSGKVVEGPGWQYEEHSFMSLPLLVRPGSVIPVGKDAGHPDYAYSEEVTLQVYEVEEGQSKQVEIPNLKGEIETIFSIDRQGDHLRVKKEGPAGKLMVLLVNNHHAEAEAQVKDTRLGKLISLETEEIVINLKGSA